MHGRIVVVDDVPAAFAGMLVGLYGERTGDRFSLAFSGGPTARACYEAAAELPAGTIDWGTVDAWWGDERCVALDDPDSNHRLVHEALLDRVGPIGSDHPMFTGDEDPERAATEYDDLLAASPPLDLVHLGLGPDGHTASLFPGSAALHSPPGALVVANVDPLGTNVHPRITFTYEAIARARAVVVAVSGAAKREALARVRAGDPTAPAAGIRNENLVWMVDRDALGDDAAEWD